MKIPKNGKYLKREDFTEFQDEFSERVVAYERVVKNIDAHEKFGKNSGIRTKNITFVVTEGCNLKCSYCYETHKTNKVMTKQIGLDGVDFILNESLINNYYTIENSQAIVLEFIGGEPFLNIDVIDDIVEYFKLRTLELNHIWATNYMISISTNGTLNHTEKVKKFIERNKERLSMGITIDGNKKLHDSCRLFHDGRGSYDLVEKAVISWMKESNDTQTKITLAPENIMYLNDAIQNMIDIGMDGAFTNCVFEEGWEIEHAIILYAEMIKLADYLLSNENYAKFYCSLFDESIGKEATETRNHCGGNGLMLAIGTDGKCYPCIRFMKYSLSNPNVKEHSIGDIYNGLNDSTSDPWLCELKKIDMITQCQFEDNKKCLDCPIASGCSLCTGYNYDKFGDPNHKATFICDMHRARVLANVYYWNKLYKIFGEERKFKLNLDKETAFTIISENEYNYLYSLSED